MRQDILYNFISPTTGRILCDKDLIFVGDEEGVARPSNALMNVKEELISLRADLTALQEELLINSIPIGSIFMWTSANLPNIQSEWLECDGSLLNRSEYSDLFDAIGTSWGEGDGTTTFNIPDCRGCFPRGWNNSKSTGLFDPDSATRTAISTGGATGDAVGSVQEDELIAHIHEYLQPKNEKVHKGDKDKKISSDKDTVVATTESTGGSETRPKNFSVMFMVKAK